jgi:hypothetical protein
MVLCYKYLPNVRYTQFQVTEFYLFCGIHIRALIVKIKKYALVGIFLNSIYLFIRSFIQSIIQLLSTFSGHSRAQAVRHRHLTAKARVRPQTSPWGICGGESGSGTGYSPCTSAFPTVSFHQCAILFHWSMLQQRQKHANNSLSNLQWEGVNRINLT